MVGQNLKPWGKCTVRPKLDEVRGILPLTAMMSLADIVLSARLHRWLDERFPSSPELFHGALPGTQCQMLAHGAALLLERACDQRSQGAVAQGDIRSYYDNVHLLRVAQWMRREGCGHALLAAALRHQLLPTITVVFACGRGIIPHRGRGSLTGSRVAGAMARCPVAQTFEACSLRCKRWAFVDAHTGSHLQGMSYVDNLFAAGSSSANSIAIIREWARHLRTTWDLHLKRSSLEVLPARGSAVLSDDDRRGFAVVATMLIVGIRVADDGGWRAGWDDFHQKSWKCFFGSAGNSRLRTLPLNKRLTALRQSMKCFLSFYCTHWGPSLSLTRFLDSTQTSMIATMQHLPRYPGESDNDFYRRRGRQAGVIAQQQGRWSSSHKIAAIAWYHHCQRHLSACGWIGPLLKKDAWWWQHRRRDVGSTSSLAGRTSTRSHAKGGISKRYVEAMHSAEHDD